MKNCALLFLLLFVISCTNADRDDDLVTITNTTGSTSTNTIASTGSSTTADGELSPDLLVEINDFIWEGLNQVYFWQEQVPTLSDTITTDVVDYLDLLQSASTPEAFFDSQLFPPDRFSFILDDYTTLENLLAGISANNGMRYILARASSDSNDILGFVTYVLPESPASMAGIRRGMIFNAIDNRILTLSNYTELLTQNPSLSSVFQFVDYDATTEVFTEAESINLTKVVDFQADPIHIAKTLNIDNRKIGYLMYNQFLNEFDSQLIQTMNDFVSEGLTDFIIDLRYNPGGSIRTCTYLASMLTGQFTNEIFTQEQWNSKLTAYFMENNPSQLTNPFVNQTFSGDNLPALNLNNIYVITSRRTASASELLINGLSSHITVNQIGDSTVGKNVGSITVYDYIDNQRNRNPNHNYAMQPIVLKLANSEGFSDYGDGLQPLIEQKENLFDLGVLGNENEPLLKTALDRILGLNTNTEKNSFLSFPSRNRIKTSSEVEQEIMYYDFDETVKKFLAFKVIK